MTKNNDIDKCKYSGYGIGFDRKRKFSVGDEFGRNCIILGLDMSSSVHLGNKKKESPTQGLHGTTLTAEKKIQLILPKIIRRFV